MSKQLLTVRELAENLNVQTCWVYGKTRLAGPGTIPRLRVGKYLRFNLDEVMDWLKKQNEAGLE